MFSVLQVLAVETYHSVITIYMCVFSAQQYSSCQKARKPRDCTKKDLDSIYLAA